MGSRYGVSFSHYGGIGWAQAELERELQRAGVKFLEIRGCPYPEMSRAEQVRQARIAGVEVLVFLEGYVQASLSAVEELVQVAEAHGIASINERMHPWALEAAAVRRDVLEAMVRAEERRYENSAVAQIWSGEKVEAVPLASPWNRDGSSLLDGEYLTDGQAFMARASHVGAAFAQYHPQGLIAPRRRIVTRAVNLDRPLTNEAGSRFALCIPSFGQLDLDQRAAVSELERAGMAVLGIHDCPWIDLARSWLTERALESGRGVFFLDHDIIFHPNDVLRLCQQALERNAVVAGPYCMRASGKNIIGSFDLPPGPIKFFHIGDTFPAYYSGLGFAAVPGDVLLDIAAERANMGALSSSALDIYLDAKNAIVRPWYALDCSTGFYAGEDVSFCNRVHDLQVGVATRQDGFDPEWSLSHSGRACRVFLDTRVRIGHRGSYTYGIEDVGAVVPRCDSLEATMTLSRKEARAALVNVMEDLPVEAKLDMLPFTEA